MRNLLIPALLVLFASGALADDATPGTTAPVELPPPVAMPSASPSTPTTPTLEDQVGQVQDATVKLYERSFQAEARLLRVETILRSLEQRGLVLTPTDTSGDLIQRSATVAPPHTHRWLLTTPALVKMDKGRQRVSAICACGTFSYVEARTAPPPEMSR